MSTSLAELQAQLDALTVGSWNETPSGQNYGRSITLTLRFLDPRSLPDYCAGMGVDAADRLLGKFGAGISSAIAFQAERMSTSSTSHRRLRRSSGGVFRNACQLIVVVAMAFLLSGCGLGREAYYCSAQRRTLSDGEFIEIAVRRYSHLMGIDGNEASIKNFHSEHPTCCRVERNFDAQSLSHRLTHLRTVEVEVNFRVSDDLRKRTGNYYEGHVMIRPCGEAVESYGTGTEVLKQTESGVR